MGKRHELTEMVTSEKLNEMAEDLEEAFYDQMSDHIEELAMAAIESVYGRHVDKIDDRASEMADRLILQMARKIHAAALEVGA